MTPSQPGFWAEVRAQALAGTAVITAAGIFGGVVYLTHTVPRQLDKVLENQTMFRSRLDDLERKVDVHSEKIIRLEAQ